MSEPGNPTPPPGAYQPGQAGVRWAAAEPTAPIAPPPVARRGRATVVLAVLSVLFFLAAAGVGTLYLLDKQKSDRTIDRQKTEISAAQQDARTKSDAVTKANADLTTAKGQTDAANTKAEALQAQVTKNAACTKSVQDFFTALEKNDDNGAARAILSIQTNCGIKIV